MVTSLFGSHIDVAADASFKHYKLALKSIAEAAQKGMQDCDEGDRNGCDAALDKIQKSAARTLNTSRADIRDAEYFDIHFSDSDSD